MTDPNAIPPSNEVVFEQIRRNADGLSDYDLDEQLAMAAARRDVATAHGHISADLWNDMAILLADVRATRAQAEREVEALTGPPAPIVRPLTAEELAETLGEES